MSEDRQSQLSAESDGHAREIQQLAEARRLKKQAKREKKAAEVAAAQAKGYKKMEWTESMEKLYDAYKVGEARLAKAKGDYEKFRGRFDQKASNMTREDHEKAGKLANKWEDEADR